MNCFQIVFLLGSLTTCQKKNHCTSGCELLSNCIFTGFFDNISNQTVSQAEVVNCFQIVFLLGSLTTNQACWHCKSSLWIAFKLYFYWVLWQRLTTAVVPAPSCELLSNCIFTGFFDNWINLWTLGNTVVNCFQIVFLLGSLTTASHSSKTHLVLWIAFKLYFYWVLWQPLAIIIPMPFRCELLSNCIFTGFFDNSVTFCWTPLIVVNCFQIVFLLGSLTTVVERWAVF